MKKVPGTRITDNRNVYKSKYSRKHLWLKSKKAIKIQTIDNRNEYYEKAQIWPRLENHQLKEKRQMSKKEFNKLYLQTPNNETNPTL